MGKKIYKNKLAKFSLAILVCLGLIALLLPQQKVFAATKAESKADSRATDTHIPTNCTNAALDSSGNDSPFFKPCVARFKAFYLGDGSGAPACPADDGSTNYQYCQDEAPRNGQNQVAKDFPDIDKLCGVFISNAKGGSWPDFSSLNGSAKQKAVDACNSGVGPGFTYAAGNYPPNEPCQAKYKGQNNLLQACYAGESLMDAHLFTTQEVKAIAQSGKLSKTDNGSTGGGAGGGAGGGTPAGGDETQSCSGEGLSFGWALCPIVEVVSNFGDTVFKSYIRPMMEQNNLSLDPNDPFYKSWQGFRFLGNVLLIGSLLAVVYSQTRGGGQ